MITPNFLLDQYVSASIFNTAFVELVASMQTLSGGSNFFIPGIVNPQSLAFGFNANLIVTVTATNGTTGGSSTPFRCLFNSGDYTDAHGTVNGTDSDVYSVNFSSLIPGTGTVTAYIVAQYASVQESQLTVSGPPSGHPDYSANFTPYIGYSEIQDSLNIFATTTVPDNLVLIELARVTLSAGQTIISAVDTSFQLLARVNAIFVTMSGDVTGNSNSNRITSLQGDPLNLAGRITNNAIVFNGSDWVPVALPTSVTVGGDISGTTNNATVNKSSAATFAANNMTANGTISATGGVASNVGVSSGGNIAAAGFVLGANAVGIGQAIMMGQLAGFLSSPPDPSVGSGPIYSNYITIPFYNTNGNIVILLKLNLGFYSVYGLSSGDVTNVSFTVNFTLPFTTTPLFPFFAFGSTSNNAFGEAGLALQLNTWTNTSLTFNSDEIASSLGGIVVAGPSRTGLTGFWWAALGY